MLYFLFIYLTMSVILDRPKVQRYYHSSRNRSDYNYKNHRPWWHYTHTDVSIEC